MAQITQYKNYRRGKRQASVETDFSSGMMFTEGTVSDGYVKTLVNFDFTTDGKNALKPRAGLRTCEFVLPDIDNPCELSIATNSALTIVDFNPFVFAKKVAISIPTGTSAHMYFDYYTTDGWRYLDNAVELSDYGIEISGQPQAGDRLTVKGSPSSGFLSDDVAIKYSKECIEGTTEYYQFILGKSNPDNTDGKIWVVTAQRAHNNISGVGGFSVDATAGKCYEVTATSRFYNNEYAGIHGQNVVSVNNTSFPVGAFLGNSFYFFSTDGELCRTYFDEDLKTYKFERCSAVDISASEAVSYGYNMLNDNPYEFTNKTNSSTFQMEGILPYSTPVGKADRKLLMTPKKNSKIFFECFFDVVDTNGYVIKWSWKDVAADVWNPLKTEGSASQPWHSASAGNTQHLEVDFIPPTAEIMVRCEAYRVTDGTVDDAVEKAMTVGFDFSVDDNKSTLNVEQVNYDLATSTGMYSWKNRLVIWGVKGATHTLFLSEIEEPAYFPYPNNVEIFDEPIISVVELMGNLMVFTTNKIYQLSVNAETGGFTTEVVQSNLFIDGWDKHLIQPIRNMLYFKSGNYYYMMVPKAQSTTGELTVAPITTPITDFFNSFAVNVQNVCRECFKSIKDGEVKTYVPEKLITYYNYLDYEFIHNNYVYLYEAEDYNRYIHFDLMYNFVNRYWKISVYEAPHLLYPFRNDATQQGILASTSLINVEKTSSSQAEPKRIIQLYDYGSHHTEDLYLALPDGFALAYDNSYAPPELSETTLSFPSATVSYSKLNIPSKFVRKASLDNHLLEIIAISGYINGYNMVELADTLVTSQQFVLDNMLFSNKQMLDTGYRDSSLFINKRYRELQLHINNLDNVDMEFGMDFNVAGEPRNTDFIYDVSQAIDEMNPTSGIIYIDATPYMSTDALDIEKINQWTIEHSLESQVGLWRVRANVSGKGVAPRLRLFTRKHFNYQLLGINWIYREMNMR